MLLDMQMEFKTNLGFVKRGCGTAIRETEPSSVSETEILFTSVWIALTCGALFQMLFVWIVSADALKRLFKTSEDMKSEDEYGFDKYGIFWGVSTNAFVFLIIISSVYTFSTISLFTEWKKGSKHFVYILSSLLILCLGGGLPVAISGAKKLTLKVPKVYLWPARLVCCCKKEYEKEAEYLATTFALWVDVSVLQLILFQGIVTVVTLSAAPFAMVLNTMVIVLVFSVIAFIFSLLFTIFGHIEHSNQQTNATATEQEQDSTVIENPSVMGQENTGDTVEEGTTSTGQEGTRSAVQVQACACCRQPVCFCCGKRVHFNFPFRVKPAYMTMVLTASAMLPLLLMIMFYGFAIAAMGSVINMEAQKNNSISFIFSIATPIVLALLTIFLQWFIPKWLKISAKNPNKASNEHLNEQDTEMSCLASSSES